MASKDIHKIDNLLIRTGWLTAIALLVAEGCSSDSPTDGVTLGSMAIAIPVLSLVLGVAALVMLVVGYLIRSRENKVVAVWDILEHATEVSIADLERSTGFSRAFIEGAVRTINRQPGSYYVVDDDAGTIVDGRMRSRIVMVEQCQSCGAHVNMQVSIDLPKAPACAHCGAPVASGDLNQLKLDRVDALRESSRKKGEFSVLLFVVLLILFWPLAVVLAKRASGAGHHQLKNKIYGRVRADNPKTKNPKMN
ncbi:MAG: hypothetical protein AAF458_16180, partial [Pseudomonadota bacterium]